MGPFSRRWERRSNDIVQQGDVVDGVKKLVDLLGWSESMDTIVKSAKERWKEQASMENANINKASEELAKSIGKTTSEKLPVNSNGQQNEGNKKGNQSAPNKNGGSNGSSGLSPFGTRTLHSLTNGFTGKGVLFRTNRNVLFMSREGPMRPNAVSQRAPLLPFRYTQRKDLSSQDKNTDF